MSRARTLRTQSRLSSAELRRQLEDVDASIIEGVVAGCALVAYCDGWVTPEETRRMRGLITRFEPAAAIGVAEALQMFETLTFEFAHNYEAGERHAFELAARLATRPRDAELLIDTCCAIADADGGFDAEERQMILRLCTLLGVDAERHGL